MRNLGYCQYCLTERATHIDHVVPKAMRRRHAIKDSDQTYHVPSCAPCNWRKGTRRYAPACWAGRLDELPGKGWQLWDGGDHLEVLK